MSSIAVAADGEVPCWWWNVRSYCELW